MAQIISKYIQLQEVSNEHSMEAQQIKEKLHQTMTASYHSPFQIKGTENGAFLQEDIIIKLISLLYHGTSYKGPRDKRFAKPSQATSLTPYFGPWIIGHRCNANKQKASLCFIVLLMSPLVSNHLIPQMLKNAKVKISFVLPSKCIAKG